ncbi:hypothetical protein OFO05_27730, partial [Escherichia coli]|nr:hypothetical protein [Escherichia coli]
FIEVFDLLNVPVESVAVTTETSSFSLHEPSVFFKNFPAAQSPRNPEKTCFCRHLLRVCKGRLRLGGQ